MANELVSIKLLVYTKNPVSSKQRLLDRLGRLLEKDRQMAKWDVRFEETRGKTNLKKVTVKIAKRSNHFSCWYCQNGHRHKRHLVNAWQRWIVCLKCGATTVEMPSHRMKRNKLGGASGINWSKN